MSIWWSLHLRREAASVPLARRLLLGTMETAGVDPDISYDLSVALSEACANAVEHGGESVHGEPARPIASRPIWTARRAASRWPTPDPGSRRDGAAAAGPPRPSDAENGRGLCLIQELADHVHIGNKPGRGGAVVSFDKILKWREDAPLMAV